MKRVLHWLLDYWYVPVLAVGAVLLVVFTDKRRSSEDVGLITKELKAIEAKRAARELVEREGAERAKEHVRATFQVKRSQLSTEAELKALELENDPVALAAYLERVSR